MRVAGFALFATVAMALGLTGCTSPAPVRTAADVPSIAAAPPAAPGTPTVPTAATKAEVCATIRTEVAAHTRPLGTALGQYVGFRAAADSPDQRAAGNAVKAELAAVADAISSAGATSTDPSLKVITANAASALDGFGHDATLLAVLDQMSEIPAVLARLTAVVQPVADACS
jgi:hypothetical protein